MPHERDDDLTLAHERTPEGHTRVTLVRDGREISGATIVPMTIRIGIAPVRMDGIGGVATDEAYRMRGLSRRVMEACVEHMKRGDAPLTTLYGIPRFYPKFGYAVLGPEPSIELAVAQVPEALPAGYAARPATPDDLPAIRTLYEGGMAEAVGPLIRDPAAPSWKRLVDTLGGGDEIRVVTDTSGDVVAYAWRASWCWWMRTKQQTLGKALRIAEASASSPAAADALLAACRAWAETRGNQHIQILGPPDGRIGMAAALRGAMVRLEHTFEGEYMGRSLDVAGLLRALRPELVRRWNAVATPWLGRLIIDTGEDRAGLTLTEGSVAVDDGASDIAATVVAISPGDMARLVFGGFPPREVLLRAGVTGLASTALAALFPPGFPYISPPDRF